MKRTSIKSSCQPLLFALAQLETWLLRDGASRIIVAPAFMEELKAQGVPEHVSITPKKHAGGRQVSRGRRNYREIRTTLAIWPEDAQNENPLPAIVCVLNGQADFHIGDYVLGCRTGDWILLPAGVPKSDGSKSHFEGDPTGRYCDLFWLYTGPYKDVGLSCWICRSEGHKHSMNEQLGRSWFQHSFLARLFGGFCNEMQSASPRPEIAVHLLLGVLLMTQGEINAGRALLSIAKRPSSQERNDPITEAMAYMEENLDRPLTIQLIANEVLLAPTTFNLRFREHTGQTFHEYYTQLRLNRAEELLQQTLLPVSLICPRVGLKYGRLRALFQEFHGCSPSEFRNRTSHQAHGKMV